MANQMVERRRSSQQQWWLVAEAEAKLGREMDELGHGSKLQEAMKARAGDEKQP